MLCVLNANRVTTATTTASRSTANFKVRYILTWTLTSCWMQPAVSGRGYFLGAPSCCVWSEQTWRNINTHFSVNPNQKLKVLHSLRSASRFRKWLFNRVHSLSNTGLCCSSSHKLSTGSPSLYLKTSQVSSKKDENRNLILGRLKQHYS